MGIGTGMFKSNISPLIAEQITRNRAVVEERKGGKVLYASLFPCYLEVSVLTVPSVFLGSTPHLPLPDCSCTFVSKFALHLPASLSFTKLPS